MKIVQTAAKYKEIQTDAKLATLNPLLTIYIGRLMELIDRTKDNDSPDRMKRIEENWKKLKNRIPGLMQFIQGDKEALKAYNTLNDEITKAGTDYEAWNQIFLAGSEVRKTLETRMKILKDMNAMLSADEVYGMASMLLAAVGSVIDDPHQFEDIAREFAKIVGEEHSRGPDERSQEIVDIDPSGVDRGQVLHTGNSERPDIAGENTANPVSEGLPE